MNNGIEILLAYTCKVMANKFSEQYDTNYRNILNMLKHDDGIFRIIPTKKSQVIHYKGHIFEKDKQTKNKSISYRCRYSHKWYKKKAKQQNPNFETCCARITMDINTRYIIHEISCNTLEHMHVFETHQYEAEKKYALKTMKTMVAQNGMQLHPSIQYNNFE